LIHSCGHAPGMAVTRTTTPRAVQPRRNRGATFRPPCRPRAGHHCPGLRIRSPAAHLSSPPWSFPIGLSTRSDPATALMPSSRSCCGGKERPVTAHDGHERGPFRARRSPPRSSPIGGRSWRLRPFFLALGRAAPRAVFLNRSGDPPGFLFSFSRPPLVHHCARRSPFRRISRPRRGHIFLLSGSLCVPTSLAYPPNPHPPEGQTPRRAAEQSQSNQHANRLALHAPASSTSLVAGMPPIRSGPMCT